jgi:eukaryotic-like serine/threonine-protein kinase
MRKGSGVFAAGTVLNGLFEVIGLLERCGNVLLYAARELDSQKTRTLKVLRLEAPPAEVLAHLNDVRCLSRLLHPHILRAYDFRMAESGELYSVLEYWEGKKLTSLVSGGLSLQRALNIFAQVCDAVQAAHNNGVILRQFRAASVSVAGWGAGTEFVKISDFSLAVQQSDRWELVPLVVPDSGACCISPELLGGAPADLRNDIFSMGCLIYEVILGKAPFTVNEIKFAARGDNSLIPPEFPARKKEAAAGMSAALEKVVRCALNQDPDSRYSSIADLKDALVITAGMQSLAELDLLYDSLRTFASKKERKEK